MIPVIFAGVSSRSISVKNKSNSLTYTVASSFVSTSPLAVTTVVGISDAFTVSNSAELQSFLLTMCMIAPESTSNSLSSGFIVDAAGKTHLSEGVQSVAYSVSLSLLVFLASFHASPRAHIALVFRSLPEIYPQILRRRDCADENF